MNNLQGKKAVVVLNNTYIKAGIYNWKDLNPFLNSKKKSHDESIKAVLEMSKIIDEYGMQLNFIHYNDLEKLEETPDLLVIPSWELTGKINSTSFQNAVDFHIKNGANLFLFHRFWRVIKKIKMEYFPSKTKMHRGELLECKVESDHEILSVGLKDQLSNASIAGSRDIFVNVVQSGDSMIPIITKRPANYSDMNFISYGYQPLHESNFCFYFGISYVEHHKNRLDLFKIVVRNSLNFINQN